MEKLYIGVDLGGTNIAAGITDAEGNILCKKSVKTNLPKPEEVLEKDIYNLCVGLCEENGYELSDIEAIGIGTPGSVDGIRGIVWSNVNFGYTNWKITEHLKALFGDKKIYVENDANAAVIAEVAAGSAKGCNDALMITLGTGVGGGAYLGGKIFAGYNYAGLEVGHTVIKTDGKQCNCGRKGCFERYAAATALIELTKEAMKNNPDSALWKICPDINKVNAKTAFDGWRESDRTATDVVNSYVKDLATGVINLINIFQPEVLCIGGGVSNEKETLIALLKPYIDAEDYARNARERTKIVIAKFRNDAGIIGAAMLGVNNG